ncbi:aminomethyltransferase family protein [Halobacterium salinarum]|uniref:aminomethyltransferase family protein n=1 Tax=Halobacterium salinarum TaxID=2242 RepID=UPI001F1E12EA|nr:aminomethyltransferase family protein [Halobacterium salinarum]MCF2206248.1 aminomethyltransferase family protein [Halobacterium salinarum]MCF2241670.1 aminomethyltransferase family protein [Halobacterium salinarum]MDL0137612.1 aminomethyltransferase family protein [Halobacterium salinarum]
MTVVRAAHEAHGATFREVAGRAVPVEYGRPDRTHRAVRNAAGVTEHAFDVVVATGEDAHEVVAAGVSGGVPTEDGRGAYVVVCDDGRVRADGYVFATDDRLLGLVPAGEGDRVASRWRERAGSRDAAVTLSTGEFGTFGVHGPQATEKVASVLHRASPPEERLRFVRGEMEGGVTVVRDDDLAGEEGYLVVCAAEDADDVFETLLVRGLNAVPFGRETWETLTLEAGTPLFASELAGRTLATLGLARLDGSDAAAAGEPHRRLVGLAPDALPASEAAVYADGSRVGEVTRAAESPMRGDPLAFAVVSEWHGELSVAADGDRVDAAVVEPPFVDTGERSRRRPEY